MKLRFGWIGLLVMVLMGCAKEPVRDDLEQYWRLERFSVLETGERVTCQQIFWSITRMVTEVAEKPLYDGQQDIPEANGYGAYIARTGYVDGGLTLEDFKVRTGTSDLKVDATVEQLRPFGINDQRKTVFRILKLTDKVLVLESDYAKLEFTRF